MASIIMYSRLCVWVEVFFNPELFNCSDSLAFVCAVSVTHEKCFPSYIIIYFSLFQSQFRK